MKLDEETRALLTKEQEILAEVKASLEVQTEESYRRLDTESARARELTSKLVSARRDVDKQMLASDEAVSHGLTKAKRKDIKNLDRLRKNPYFARIELAEDMGDGRTRSIEYKLGTVANIDCRIIDWRKAPIAKLFYDYQEGEEYSEIIQGREREGRISVRNKLEIKDGVLKKVSLSRGDFLLGPNGWQPVQGKQSGGRENYGSLRPILSLITPDQFSLITEQAESAVLIQGIAGSGKTTVALHRLAWLLHEENSDMSPEECGVVVHSKTLKTYLSSTLPSIDVDGVKIDTLREWMDRCLRQVMGVEYIQRTPKAPPPGVDRVKSSFAMLQRIEEEAKRSELPLPELMLKILNEPLALMECDETGLLDRELIQHAYTFSKDNLNSFFRDASDDAIFVRMSQIRQGGIALEDGSIGYLKHIVIDEVQDLHAVELAALVGAVKTISGLTLVGDVGQQIGAQHTFPGWEKLRKHWNLGEETARFTALTVSHRSSLPIMRLADHVLGENRTTSGRQGKVPIWFKCKTEQEGVRQAVQWIRRVTERFPGSYLGVVCKSPEEAKFVYSLLTPSFGSAVELLDDNSGEIPDGILVTDIRTIKGLEFPHVLLWNPSAKSYPLSPGNRRALYVAITRAEDHLGLVTWGNPSPLLPHIHSRLVRGYELEMEEEG